MDQLFAQHEQLLGELTSYGRKHSSRTKPQSILKAVLPLATLVKYQGHAKAQPLLHALLGGKPTDQSTTFGDLAEYFPNHHSGADQPVRLTHWAPRKEFDLLPDMLYTYSSLPYAVIAAEIDKWPYERKLTAFEAYLKQHGQSLHSALSKAHYSWDILYDCRTIYDLLQLQAVENVSLQALTPRHGYDVPAIIEEAGLTDAYLASFDLSLKLYSQLQQAGLTDAAQYATLQGHKLRCHLSLSAQQAVQLFKAKTTTAVVDLLKLMDQTMADKHPILAEKL